MKSLNLRLTLILTGIFFISFLAGAAILIYQNKPEKDCVPGTPPELGLHAGLADPNFDTDGDCIPNGKDNDANGDGIIDP